MYRFDHIQSAINSHFRGWRASPTYRWLMTATVLTLGVVLAVLLLVFTLAAFVVGVSIFGSVLLIGYLGQKLQQGSAGRNNNTERTSFQGRAIDIDEPRH